MTNKISIIIPTLNEAANIVSLINLIRSIEPDIEIIVADGGSSDGTVEIATRLKASVVHSPAGRGGQMHAGAMKSTGDILWFVHADSSFSPDAVSQIETALKSSPVIGGNLTIRFDGQSRPARFMTWFYPRLRSLGLMYGDSGLFLRREVYERIGGFRSLPLFEDIDLIDRIRKEGNLVNLGAEIVTSSRRFEQTSFIPVFVQWVLFQCLYWFGVSPFWLAKIYYPGPRKTSNAD